MTEKLFTGTLNYNENKTKTKGRHGGLVVEHRTPEREVGGSILTQVSVLCLLARFIYLPKSTGNTQGEVAPSRHD